MIYRQPRFIAFACVLFAALILAGCSESPQEKYNDATSKLQDAKKARQEAQKKVASAKDKVKDAKKKLNEAQDKLQNKRQKVIAATQAVNKTVDDGVLFRTLQRDLLDKDKFPDSAISVEVNKRVVTLTGTVPDKDTHKQAVQAVRDQVGVASVNDRLKVSDNASQPNDSNSNKSDRQKSNGEQ